MSRRRVWIDTDPAVTAGNGEVDDVFALVQALRSPELHIAGISATHGNAGRDHGLTMARETIRLAGRGDVAVFGGCVSAEDDEDNEATVALRTALEDGPLAIAALGPLTTIAAALSHPDTALANVEDIVFVGGRRRGLEFRAVPYQKRPFRDFNFESDVAAAKTILNLGVPLTLAGWESASTLWLTPAHLTQLRASGDGCATWLADGARGWMQRWTGELGAPGFTPFDTLAIGWLVRPDLMKAETMGVAIEHDPARALLIADPEAWGAKARYLTLGDPETMRSDLIKRLTADLRG